MELSKKVKALRKKQGLSQLELAIICGKGRRCESDLRILDSGCDSIHYEEQLKNIKKCVDSTVRKCYSN